MCQMTALELASGLRSSLAVHFLDHRRLFAADGPSTSPYAANALLLMSEDYKAVNQSVTGCRYAQAGELGYSRLNSPLG